ncbi:MAG: PLP-dependent aminotransferase family protein [Cyanobacteria bacterium SZAS LIN-3]|nr:PLP-dependent aminotransferase family protein [Cyanobacteria bacterium SZAS LIN-3]MBS2005986.1 PLP-dependent aminotransferase family protein [Cyanobacteria bacterium SZAS TMP-1]
MNQRNRIIEHIRSGIEEGRYKPFSLVPPTRILAEQFGVSRDTVVRAYKILAEQNYIVSSATKGFYVTEKPPTTATGTTESFIPITADRLSVFGEQLRSDSRRYPISSDFADSNFGGPPSSLLPVKKWQETIRTNFKELRKTQYIPEFLGKSELRSAIAAFLYRTKQMTCGQNEVVVFSSTFSAVHLLCQLLLNPGDTIAVEDPGFGGIRNIAAAQSLKLCGIPLDEEGIVVEELSRLAQAPKMVYVTTSHQEPTGINYSARRRQQLLDWAKRNNAWIIEDDYDGYFHYTKTSEAPIRALDRFGTNVIYLSTFWRLLYPLTSIGFCVLPRGLLDLVGKSKIEVEGASETVLQAALAQLLSSGFIEKYMRRVTRVYSERRIACIQACAKHLPTVKLFHSVTGTNLTMIVDSFSESVILNAASQSGIPLNSLNAYYLNEQISHAYTLDFGSMSPAEMDFALFAFAKKLDDATCRP